MYYCTGPTFYVYVFFFIIFFLWIEGGGGGGEWGIYIQFCNAPINARYAEPLIQARVTIQPIRVVGPLVSIRELVQVGKVG